jgi:uncharacterized protein (TIGR02145 family)
MKRKISTYHMLFVALLFILSASTKLYATDYTISFTGSGAATIVSSVVVQNLTQSTTVTVPSGSSLVLIDATAVPQLAVDKSLSIYPNPIVGKSTVSYYSEQGGNTDISVFGIDGRCLIREAKTLNIGLNQFKLSLPNGVFTIHINDNGILHFGTVISQTNNKAELEYIGTQSAKAKPMQKVESSALALKYSAGDQLLFKGISGNYSTIVTDKPTSNKTINFNFVECKDADGNYYSVVQIGTQVWMAENLKTTKYNDGTSIPNVTDDRAWRALSTPAYCWYNNDATTYKNTYGALYNWYSVNTAKLAPVGWHIPTDDEWTTLTTYLGGLSVAGGKLKEAGTAHWRTPNTGATNETGFSALPGGCHNSDYGYFPYLGYSGYWWSSTESNTGYAWSRDLNYNYSDVRQYYFLWTYGFSVRCLIGDIPVLSTTTTTSITSNSAISGGDATYDGNATVTARGVCWNTTGDPTITDNKTTDGSGTGSFTSKLTGLTPNTTYYVRAYATNSYGSGYGSLVSFTTTVPTPVTLPFSFSDAVAPCSDVTGMLTTQQMSQIYTATGLSMTEFNLRYTLSYSGEGIVKQTASTYPLYWTLTANQIWTKVMTFDPPTFTATAVYTPSDPSLYPIVTIPFTRRFAKPGSLEIPSSRLIANQWYNNFTMVYHSAFVIGGITEFRNNINEAFIQNADKSLNGISPYEYYFSYLQPTLTDGSVNYTLTPSANGKVLYYNNYEVIATINPFVSGVGDILALNLSSATAQKLLYYNTVNLKARIGIRSVYCTNLPQYLMPVTINGNAYFDVVFVRP